MRFLGSSARNSGRVTPAEIRETLGFSAKLVFLITKALGVQGYVGREISGLRFLLTQKPLTLVHPKREDISLAQISWETLRLLIVTKGKPRSHISMRSGFARVFL